MRGWTSSGGASSATSSEEAPDATSTPTRPKGLAVVKAKVRTLTKGMRNQPLWVLLHRLNWVLRGWTTYVRHGSSSATFDYLRAFTWRRVVTWLRRKHPRINWKELRRRYLPGW